VALLDRNITAPDGMEWVVGRKLLFGPPRYIGFRFGTPKPAFERPRIRRVPVTASAPVSPSALVSRTAAASWPEDETTDPARRSRYRHTGGTIWVPVPSGRSFSGGTRPSAVQFSGGGGSFGSSVSTAGGSHQSSSAGSHSTGRSKGGGAAGGLVGVGAVLLRFLQVLLIAVAVIAAVLITVFVLIPALIFAFWALLVGAAILWHAVTRRAWIVEAREHRDAPLVLAWTVLGWRTSRRVIDEVADAIAEGRDPQPTAATRVTVA
jgi:hypothetical protein